MDSNRQSFFARLLGFLGGGASTDAPAPAPEPEVVEECRRLATSGRKIDAIKVYRQATGAGLKQSKEAVERLMRDAA